MSVAPSEPRSHHPVLSRRHDVPAFTSLRQMVKPNSGVTIVNVYNKDNNEPEKRRYKPRQVFQKTAKATPTSSAPQQRLSPQKQQELQLEPTQPDFVGSEDPQHVCLATDEERRYAIKEDTKVLPKWSRAEAAAAKHEMHIDDYDEGKAQRDWDTYFAGKQKDGPQKMVLQKRSEETVPLPRSTETAGTSERAVSMTPVDPPPEEPSDDHASGAFYGTTETERICMTAIQHVLKAERELQLLQFTSDNVLPQTKQCLEKVRWVHECLKLFNTHFRDLQEETDEYLQKKTGNHFTINMKAAPKNDLPFPAHM